MKKRYFFCFAKELPEERFLIQQVGKHSVGGIRIGDRFVFILNLCPHAFAKICRGTVVPHLVILDNQKLDLDPQKPMLRCPWHGWEFDLETGKTVFSSTQKLAFIPYDIEDEKVFITL